MVAASVYSAMRVEGCGAPVGSVCSVLGVSETATMREVKRVQEAVDIDIPVGTPSMFVDHIIDELVEMIEDIDPDDVSSEVEDAKDITSSIAEELAETGYTSGYSNSGVAAAIVYGFGVVTPWVESVPTQQQVADVAGVSDITIRNHYKNILDEIPIKEYVENHRGDFVNASGGERDQTASGEYEVERDSR
jgi:transcription initiation factor TFIIB